MGPAGLLDDFVFVRFRDTKQSLFNMNSNIGDSYN